MNKAKSWRPDLERGWRPGLPGGKRQRGPQAPSLHTPLRVWVPEPGLVSGQPAAGTARLRPSGTRGQGALGQESECCGCGRWGERMGVWPLGLKARIPATLCVRPLTLGPQFSQACQGNSCDDEEIMCPKHRAQGRSESGLHRRYPGLPSCPHTKACRCPASRSHKPRPKLPRCLAAAAAPAGLQRALHPGAGSPAA